MHQHSPLRYPGGKARLGPFMAALIAKNGLHNCTYIEPFAGGGGIAFHLLHQRLADTVVLNDIDPAVHALWSAMLHHTEDFCRRILDAPLTIEEWERQRAIYLSGRADLVDLGFAAFYLNRTNRSGIIRTGGPIGGKTQAGRWRLDARFNRARLVERVRSLAAWKDRITLSNLDAEAFLADLDLPDRHLVYLDPPYFSKGKLLYTNFYRDEDHARLARKVQQSDWNWIVSYDNHPTVRDLYADQRSIEYDIQYSARHRRLCREVMFFCDRLEPPTDDPLSLTARRRRRASSLALFGSAQ